MYMWSLYAFFQLVIISAIDWLIGPGAGQSQGGFREPERASTSRVDAQGTRDYQPGIPYV